MQDHRKTILLLHVATALV